MSREPVSNPATPTLSVGTPKISPNGLNASPTDQASEGTQAQDRIARRAYDLYEQGGRQEGRALEDWVNAERQLDGASGK